jgi:hypothetical protein
MYEQCDEEGNKFNLMESMVDHKTGDHAMEWVDVYIKHRSNNQFRNKNKGWHLCIEWKDRTTSWEHLVDINEINPV